MMSFDNFVYIHFHDNLTVLLICNLLTDEESKIRQTDIGKIPWPRKTNTSTRIKKCFEELWSETEPDQRFWGDSEGVWTTL